MRNGSWTSSILLISTLSLIVACGPVHQWPVARSSNGPYIDSGREFSVDLPAEIVSVNSGGSGRVRNIDFVVTSGLGAQDWYSVEWTTLKEGTNQKDEQFYSSWEKFLPEYLANNFGNGHYTLRKKEHSSFGGGHPSIRFAGEGVNNGGGAGFIYGTAVGFGNRVAMLYVIRNGALREVGSFESMPGYLEYQRFVNSLKTLNINSPR